MMPFSRVLASAKCIIRLNAEVLNTIAFGPHGHDRYSGALISLALRHLDTITELISPDTNRWPSAFALSRVAADAALRSVYLGFGDNAPNFARRYKAFVEEKPNPFGGPKDLLGGIRDALSTHNLFTSGSGVNPPNDRVILHHLEVDWASLSSFTHGGEIQARFALHEVRTGEPPHEYIRAAVLFATTRAVTECVGIVLAQRGEPQRGDFVAIEFMKAFPPDETDG